MEKEKINYRKPILEFQCQSEGPSRKKKKLRKMKEIVNRIIQETCPALKVKRFKDS